MGGATPVYNGKIILEVPVDFPLNTTFLSRCLKVGKDTPSFYRTGQTYSTLPKTNLRIQIPFL